MNDPSSLRGCPRCGLVQRVPVLAADCEARCARCGDVIVHGAHIRGRGWGRNRLCAALALAALICYPLGVTLPVLKLERMGFVNEASIWAGSIEMLSQGQWFVGLIVLVCSVVIPVLKLAGLFVLASRPRMIGRHHQSRMYRWIEIAGRWGMIDVLLVALLVAAVKLGDLVEVHAGPGVAAFATCVLLSLLASAVFDPHAIWETRDE
ncbi:paraquat-inducible protein A [Planctomycetales bacterium ZRK34]|nr:paraquat-inducible protein A [Planctomycetales bacterium ZRK34]